MEQTEENLNTNTPRQTQTNIQDNWLDEEYKNTQTQTLNFGERKPYMKFVEGKVIGLTIDFTKEFGKWTENKNNVIVNKAIIPVVHDGEEKVWWLNKKNPAYRKILEAGKAGRSKIYVLQTGKAETTRYDLVEI